MNRSVILGLCALATAHAEVGSRACAPCHQQIWQSYSATPMAKSSGAIGSLPAAQAQQFTSPGRAVRYAVTSRYTFIAHAGDLEVSRPLRYFIGSGAVGRSFLTQVDRYLFQAPVSYYAANSEWRVSPGFERSESLNVSRPVESSCLNCHAGSIQTVAGTINAYNSPPFRENGIACERCHGPGERHIASPTRATIVNPDRLAPARRDSVCAQCHLSGEVRIAKLDAKPYTPGGLLSAASTAFVYSPPQARQVNGHVEELSRSKCRLQSGDKLWCGTCHDPHSVSAPAAKAAYYRQRCLACHQPHNEGDCTTCHMPRSEVRDVQHAAYTDHTIPKVRRTPDAGTPTLVAFSPGATDRDYALAQALVALRDNNRALGMKAFEALRSAYAEQPSDTPVASQLAQLYDRMGQDNKACEIYGEIHKTPFPPPAAAINWGTCLAKEGRLTESIPIWQGVTERSPSEDSAWTNLAAALIQTGHQDQARTALEQALRFNPSSRKARELLAGL